MVENGANGFKRSTKVSMLINRLSKGVFKGSRGLRQGNLLPPFLFILVTETLNKLVVEAKGQVLLEGCQVGLNGPSIPLLQFADDVLLFI